MRQLLFPAIVIIFLFSCADKSNKDSTKTDSPADIEPTTKIQVPEYTASETDSIAVLALLKKFSSPGYLRAKDRKNLLSIVEQAEDFETARVTLQDIYNPNPEAIKNEKKLKALLIKIQKEDFPILRQNFVAYSKDKLWEDNIKVTGYNDAAPWISFVAGAFADHAVIKKSQEALSDRLTQLRFKRAIYKWYDGDSDATYYNLNSKDDGDIE